MKSTKIPKVGSPIYFINKGENDMRLIEELKYQWWKRKELKKEFKATIRQFNEWEKRKLKEKDLEYRKKYAAYLGD